MIAHVIESVTLTKDNMAERWRLTAFVQLLAYDDQPARFSVTGDVYRAGKMETCGAIHDEIAHHFPELAPLIALHLCDRAGAPLHDLENTRYWMGLSRAAPSPTAHDRLASAEGAGFAWMPEIVARHLRVSVEDALVLRAYVAGDGNETEALKFVLNSLRAGWQKEADAAIELLRALSQNKHRQRGNLK